MSKTRAMTPERDLLRALSGEVQLEEFLDEGEFVEALYAARWRVIRVFATARTAPKKGATPGCILGLDERLTSLTTYVLSTMHFRAQRKIYDVNDLPRHFRSLTTRQQQAAAAAVRYELVMRLLSVMKETNELWRMEGEWLVPQSVLDEYLLMVKSSKANYRNDRSFHGRPRRDRERLGRVGLAPGVSVGAC